ncbi:MAG: response regulator [Anaerolineaceae bacterium]|nr:response regulator [Anaerolineaceae bacterium]
MKKILIVDDDFQNLYMLEVLLKTNGYEVLMAKSGVEALNIARKLPIDLIVSDILMPEMDGFSLCREWKADEQLRKIPFVFYTATYTDEKDEVFALSLGADRFVIKPIAPDEMLAIVNEMLSSPESEIRAGSTKLVQEQVHYYKEYSEVLVRKLEGKMQQLQQANKRLTSLYQASCELVTLKTHGDIIKNVLQTIVDTAGYPEANYFFYDHRDQKLKLLDAVGFSTETMTTYREDLIFNLGESKGIVGLVAEKKECLNIPDVEQEENWITLDTSVNSALFAPVYFNENLFGVISLFSQHKNAFNEEDEKNILALVNSMAITFENRMQQEEVHRINLQLENRISERTSQLEHSNRELEAFAQSVTYDLRVPLRAIEGYSRLLEDTCKEKMMPEETGMLSIIHANARKMGQLINDLLTLSRSKSDVLSTISIDMQSMAMDVFKSVALAEEQKKINIEIKDLSPCTGDPKLIQQVWSSLLSKAVFYVLQNEQSQITITSESDANMLLYRICINCLDAKNIITLMNIQNQENPFGNTELGLAIVTRILDRYQGKVWVEGTAEDGVSFCFSLLQNNHIL